MDIDFEKIKREQNFERSTSDIKGLISSLNIIGVSIQASTNRDTNGKQQTDEVYRKEGEEAYEKIQKMVDSEEFANLFKASEKLAKKFNLSGAIPSICLCIGVLNHITFTDGEEKRKMRA